MKFNAEGNETVNMYIEFLKSWLSFKTAQSKNAMHQFAKFMNINAYPTLIFLDENQFGFTIYNQFNGENFSAKELELLP